MTRPRSIHRPIAVLNGVVLVSYINRLRDRGQPLDEAVREGRDDRLRLVVAVPVMDVRVVWVAVRQRLVIVGVRMRLLRWVVGAVLVLMMLVVAVPMSV